MKSLKIVIFGLIIVYALSSLAFAQDNKVAFFFLDADVATAGYQGGSSLDGIAGNQRVGFGVYVKNVDQLRAVKVDFTWDGAMAAYNTSSGAGIALDEVNINGAAVTRTEANALGSVTAIDVANVSGHFAQDIAKLGGDAFASQDYALAYFFVVRTVAGFTASDSFIITAKIKVANDAGVVKDLGERDFYVNGYVDVKNATWGQVKNQFKDF